MPRVITNEGHKYKKIPKNSVLIGPHTSLCNSCNFLNPLSEMMLIAFSPKRTLHIHVFQELSNLKMTSPYHLQAQQTDKI